MTKTRLLTIVLLTAAAALLFFWATSNRGDEISRAQVNASLPKRAVSPAPAIQNPPSPTGNVAAAQTMTAPAADSLYSTYRVVANFGANFAAFTSRAASDAEAQYFRAKILETCTAFSGPILERLEERAGKAAPVPGRMEAIALLKNSCRDVRAQSAKESSSALIREAAQRGDRKSQAYLFRFEPIGIGEKSAADTALVRTLALTRDPVVINNLDGYFEVRNNKLTWSIPGIDGPVSGAEMANAFRLTACALGYDCSAASIDAQIACAYRGYCDGDWVAQIKNNIATPAGFARAEQIRAVILAGFSSGVWPAGFWSGIGTVRK